MNDFFEDDVKFEASQNVDEGEGLVVDLDGWEGPLHLLLALARKNKVDLGQISILALADQYLAYVQDAREKRLDIAAEYLVMASWLAYLKSRLLLPKPRPNDDEPEPEAMAAALAFRLVRLDAMRLAGQALFSRALLDRDVFDRGDPEGIRSIKSPVYEAELFDLLKAYAARREYIARSEYKPAAPRVYNLEEARTRLSRLAKRLGTWERLDSLVPQSEELGPEGPEQASILASSLLAALEITKDGEAELRQDKIFAPIWMRGKSVPAANDEMDS